MVEALSRVDRDAGLKKYAPLVKRIAYHLMARLPPSVQVDDMIQAGLIGLVEALERYDGDMGAQFESYASQRIRGAMLDELREADWMPRNARRQSREIEQAIHTLEQRLQRPPNEQEIAEIMGLTLSDYQDRLCGARGMQLLYYEDFLADEDSDFLERYTDKESISPLDILSDERFKMSLVKAIETLPEREKAVMGMYYERDMNLKEIGEVLGVSESRVCQIHGQAISRLRSKLKEWTALE
jgi:RNA polymerase sigma factor FliA